MCSSTSGFLVRDEELILSLYIFDFWLVLVQSCALNAHLWLKCAGCSSGAWLLSYMHQTGAWFLCSDCSAVWSKAGRVQMIGIICFENYSWSELKGQCSHTHCMLSGLLLSCHTLQNFYWRSGWITEILNSDKREDGLKQQMCFEFRFTVVSGNLVWD